ncbi:ATP-dependent zinc metalloprotease FtsH [Candidatus Parcubacteria bacterium]|nr:MAG: ATP-dependent zinc metalloprotease FtsH [Candidatus Parcubacteria bacterium]
MLLSLFMEAGKTEQISLNRLAKEINAGKVESIAIKGETLLITLKGGDQLVAKKELETGLTETLVNLGVLPEAMQSVKITVEDKTGFRFWASILIPTIFPLLIILGIFWFMFRQAKTGVNQAFTFGRSRIRLSSPSKEKVTFKDVAGLKEAKEELQEVVEFLKSPKKFLEMGAKIPRGVLLVGPPGTGKTLLARAVAGESNVPFFHTSASEFVEMFVGVGAARIRDAFATAKRAAPAILFIDEIDAVGRQRGAGLGGGNDEREQTLNQILVELDGFDRDTRVIVLAATNRPDVLDPALLRPGRFDRRVVLDLPDIKEREAILAIHSRGKTLGPSVDLKQIAIRTPGFSGADLANLMNEAAILAARRNKKYISQEDILESIDKVLLGPERRSRVISPKEKEITAYHEGGHALVAASLKDSDPVRKVTIISRGMAGGYTLKLPSEERRLRTRAQFLSELAVMLGGYAAEKITFGDVSTGASNDLREASELARKLVTRYGMSETLGPITFGKTDELLFLGKEIATEKNYSERTAAAIDKEVQKFILKAYETAKKILTKHKRALKKIATTLIEKETIEQDEFYALLKPFRIKPATVAVR